MTVITGPNDDKSVHKSVLMTPRNREQSFANAVDFILRKAHAYCDRVEEDTCLAVCD